MAPKRPWSTVLRKDPVIEPKAFLADRMEGGGGGWDGTQQNYMLNPFGSDLKQFGTILMHLGHTNTQHMKKRKN